LRIPSSGPQLQFPPVLGFLHLFLTTICSCGNTVEHVISCSQRKYSTSLIQPVHECSHVHQSLTLRCLKQSHRHTIAPCQMELVSTYSTSSSPSLLSLQTCHFSEPTADGVDLPSQLAGLVGLKKKYICQFLLCLLKRTIKSSNLCSQIAPSPFNINIIINHLQRSPQKNHPPSGHPSHLAH
jgi:hypothetical protein